MTLWYFETVTPRGTWAPNTAPSPPATTKQAGVLRLGASNMGPRIRAIQQVPDHMIGRTLDQLQAHLGERHA